MSVPRLPVDGGTHCYQTPLGPLLRETRYRDQVLAKPALIPWSAKLERAHVLQASQSLYTGLVAAGEALTPDGFAERLCEAVGKPYAYKQVQNTALDTGSETHAWIEWAIRGRVGAEPPVPEANRWAVQSMQQWFATVDLRPDIVESTVYTADPPVAGTLDFFGHVKGTFSLWGGPEKVTVEHDGLAVGDWKTSKALFSDVPIQVAVYGKCLADMGLCDWPIPGFIIRAIKDGEEFRKRKGKVEARIIPADRMETYWRCFKAIAFLHQTLFGRASPSPGRAL